MESSRKRHSVENRGGSRPAKTAVPPAVDASRDRMVAALELSSIELGLVAALSLEMARDCDEVAGDARQRLEARRTARWRGSGWRERARLFQLEARRRGAEPTDPWKQSFEPSSWYAGLQR
jgi:hypothetical protein